MLTGEFYRFISVFVCIKNKDFACLALARVMLLQSILKVAKFVTKILNIATFPF